MSLRTRATAFAALTTLAVGLQAVSAPAQPVPTKAPESVEADSAQVVTVPTKAPESVVAESPNFPHADRVLAKEKLILDTAIWRKAVWDITVLKNTIRENERKAEVARQAELARQADEARKAEAARQAEAARDAERARDADRAQPRSPAPQSGGGPGSCGGDLPPCSVMQCESGGNAQAENPSSSASGKWQIIDSTWNGYGGYARASDAPASVQDERARQIYAGGAGRGNWVC